MRFRRTGVTLAALALMVVAAACRAPEQSVESWDLLELENDDARRAPGYVVSTLTEYGETRHVVEAPAPDRLAYPLVVPAGAVLDMGFAVQATRDLAFVPELADPVRFQVVLTAADGGERILLEQDVDIRSRPADRRWFDARIDLGDYANQRATLAVVTAGPKSDTTALFSAPRVLAPATTGDVSVLLVTIDSLRADHVGAYGYVRPTTPHLDALAAEAVRFAHAYAGAPTTLPSIAQILTGQVFPADGDETLIGPIARAGIPSAAVVSNVYVLLWLTLGRKAAPHDQFDAIVTEPWMDAAKVSDRAIAWLERHPRERFALYVHYGDANPPYRLPAGADVFGDAGYDGPVGRGFDDVEGARAGRYGGADQARIVSLYDASVRYVDEQLGRVLDHLRAMGRLEQTLVVITADQGEELWDHGEFSHGQSLHDELLHVPLLVRLPRAASSGTVVQRQVPTIDVAPSVLAWAGLRRAGAAPAHPLAEAIAHAGDAGDDVVATAVNPDYPIRYALRTSTHKLVEDIHFGTRVLYDLVRDPREQHDVLAEAPDAATALGARLDAARAPLRRRGFQLRVVGPPAGSPFRLRLEGGASGGQFALVDRTQGADTTLDLSKDGRVLVVEGRTDRDGRGFRFDRVRSALAEGPDTVTTALETDGGSPAAGTVRVGAGSALPAGGAFDASARAIELAKAPDCEAPESGAHVCLWRYPSRTSARSSGPAAAGSH